ncbi:MAG: glycoside hydrolase family 1 protein [Chloroflexota bacterium]|nr:MAG: glycoside hydrolase family 1 protein [Chloroflexota bacterium]
MVKATFEFPTGFLWGTATAAHQVEGRNTNNNWYQWEQDGHVVHGHECGLACDWWGGRWREDFDRAAEEGQNAHRLSIEWSRIQPAPDSWDEDALDRYREMIRGLHERGMTPMVTLHHFTDPIWIMEQGGWENEEIVARFQAYVEKVVAALKEYVTYWCTINEPNVYAAMGYLTGEFPPGKQDMSSAFQVMTNLVKGHAAAYHAIHKIQEEAEVGLVVNYRGMIPHRAWFPPDRIAAWIQSRTYNDFFPHAAATGKLKFPFKRQDVPEAKGTQDFLGVNYYTQERVSFSFLAANELFGKRFFDPEDAVSETGFIAHHPTGLFDALKWGMQFDVPLIVTENGVEDSTDKLRPRYLAEHIHQIWRGLNYNWPIKGYFYWSLVDNFEWERGWTQRFGLWELDVDSQTRSRRPSVDFYAEICQNNALSSKMVAEYAPEALEKLFPE